MLDVRWWWDGNKDDDGDGLATTITTTTTTTTLFCPELNQITSDQLDIPYLTWFKSRQTQLLKYALVCLLKQSNICVVSKE